MKRAMMGLVWRGALAAALLLPGARVAVAQEAVTLEEALRTALERNRDLEVARQGLWGADEQVREAWSAVFPKVEVSANYQRNLEVPGQFLPAMFFDPDADPGEQVLVRFGSDNSWRAQARVDQPLFDGAAFIGVGAADRYRSLQGETVRGKAQEVATRVRKAYYDVLLAEEGERVNAESVRRVRETLEETRAMNAAGLVGDYDVLRLEVELANLETALERAENAARAARRQLAVELDLPLERSASLDVAGSLSELSLDDAGAVLLAGGGLARPEQMPAEEVLSLARQRRSELRQLRLTETLRRAELKAEQSEYLPKVSLFAAYDYNAQADGALNPFGFDGAMSSTSPTVGLQVTMPLFSGFARPARVGQRRALLEQAKTELDLTGDQVESQVRTLLDAVQEARRRAEVQGRAVAQATRGYEIAHAQFREGLGSRLELTEAEVALRETEFNYAEAVHDYLTARADLDLAVGMVPMVDE